MTLRWKIAQKAELKWWKGYLKNKTPEEYLVWKKNYWTRFLNQIQVSIEASECILDAGCGPAGIFTVLSDYQVVAIDPLLDHYEAELDHFNPEWYPAVQFKTLSLEDFDDQGQYDTIFCLNAVNHVADWEGSIRHLVQALKPGGRLILSSDVHRWGVLKPIFRLLPGDILHPQQHDAEEYREVLRSTGVQIESEQLIKREGIFDYMVWIAKKRQRKSSIKKLDTTNNLYKRFMREKLSTGAKWESIVGYSRAVRIGNVIEIAGTAPVKGENELVGGDDAYEQAYYCCSKIKAAIEEMGGQITDVVRTRIFVTDISRWEEYGRAHGAFFKDIRPVTTMVEVTQLVDPRWLVEIEATAIISSE